MKIVCPQCEFTRTVPSEKLPSKSVMATCPQCQHRFKVLREDAVDDATTFADNAIPHGAHVPSNSEPLYTQGDDQNTNTTQSNTIQENTTKSNTTNSDNINSENINPEDLQKAAEAYAQQANDADQNEVNATENPWDYVQQLGYFSAFYQTVVWVLFAPARFFSGLLPQVSRLHVMIFYLAVRTIQIAVSHFWGHILATSLAPEIADDPELKMLITLLTSEADFIFALLQGLALATIELFFGALFYFVMFRLIDASKSNFSIIFQVLSFSSAPLLLAIIPAIGMAVGYIWSIACLVIGCRYALRLSWPQTIMGIAPLYALGLFSVFSLVSGLNL